MSLITCFSTCFGRRHGKTYKAQGRNEPVRSSREARIDPDKKAFHARRSISQVTTQTLSSEKSTTMAPKRMYSDTVEAIRNREYPNMANGVYLDHSGTTVYARSLVEDFSKAMITGLWGNPHSENLAARMSGDMVDAVRRKTLNFLGADPEHFDLVFVANATAGIKLVAEAFRDLSEKTSEKSFWYGYHSEAHSSLLGVRQLTEGKYQCFRTDAEVESWLEASGETGEHKIAHSSLGLFAYPGQSNLSGRRLPQSWPGTIRAKQGLRNTYTLFDAAALAMTSSLGSLFADPEGSPDFTCLSLYKIFGFPDLGALVVRRDSGHILSLRKYFGGGTIAQVFPMNGDGRVVKKAPGLGDPKEIWNIHDGVEDGTLPFHSILALGLAIDTHIRLYGSMEAISSHCTYLASMMYRKLTALRYPNGTAVIELYADIRTGYDDPSVQGATFAFNIRRPDGSYVSWMDVEKMANADDVYIRAGGVCCPGGVMKALQYEEWEWNRMFSSGHACGAGETAIVNRHPTGIVRASIGAMTTVGDVEALVTFIQQRFAMAPEPGLSSVKTTGPVSHREVPILSAA